MGLPAPLFACGHGGGGEHALNAQFVLEGGHVLNDGLERVEALDLVHGGILGGLVLRGEVLVHDGVVVDDAIALDHVGDAVHGVALGHGQRLIGKHVVKLGVGKVEAVVLPALQAHRAVDLEDGGGVGLGDLRAQRLLVGAGGGGDDVDVNARLRLVGGGDLFVNFGDLGLEVEEVDLGGLLREGAHAAQREDQGQSECHEFLHNDSSFSSIAHGPSPRAARLRRRAFKENYTKVRRICQAQMSAVCTEMYKKC